MAFGERLRELRKERGMTQDELGTIFGLSGRAIGYYETGERFPPEDILNKLADCFDTTTDYLLGRTEKRKGIIQAIDRVSETITRYDTSNDDPHMRALIEALSSLSPEERSAVEIMIKTLAAAKKEQTAVGG